MLAPEIKIRTTITSDSMGRHFGAPMAIDYRAHPGDQQDENPLTIFEGMKEHGVQPLPDISILKGTIYSFKNRKTITRWLRDVCAAFRLKSTTLGLAVQLTDAFLVGHLKKLKVDRCQLCAVTCLWIAAKFEEMDEDLPNLRKIVEVCDSAYNAPEVLDMEESVLSYYKWRLPHTTVVNHVYLQIHMLSTEKLVQKGKHPGGPQVEVTLLVLDNDGRPTSCVLPLPAGTLLREVLPQLCAASKVPFTTSIDVFQLYGNALVLAQRTRLETAVGALPTDYRGTIRLFVSSARSQVSTIFIERNNFVILRTINEAFLDICDTLTAEVVTHVEFLQLPSHVTALGIVALALALRAPEDPAEVRQAVLLVLATLGISASQALAAADLLNTKYAAKLAEAPEERLPPTSDKVRQSLSQIFGRPLA
ncbi:mitotic cyclin [Strigomonas culicis]|uniref:Mitotic cyclin n=1 Tax=Strigomonas culicis TaxID=28005 RepID=S9UWL2_9TRYP|nr:mitotic cyclin [Strigomonas culicis]EPY33268.1 mitotic cyclin [Strigomonas culicis]|eukprot:EPY25530.1 mitotic cyclin [Strigomonas culicis]